MKKLMTALAVCAIASLSLASGGVTSANVVGYQTLSVVGTKYNMLGVQWDKVGGGSLSVQDVFAGTAGLTGSTFADVFAADRIKVWDPVTSGYVDFWLYAVINDPAWDGKWIDGTGSPATATFSAGSTFWLQSKGTNVNVISAGQAPSAATISQAIVGGKYNMIINPYPTTYPLNGSFNWLTAGAVGSTFADVFAADRIKVWDPNTAGYTDYWLYAFISDPAWDGKWIDGTGSPATYALPMGTPAWYQSKGSSFTLVFSKPY